MTTIKGTTSSSFTVSGSSYKHRLYTWLTYTTSTTETKVTITVSAGMQVQLYKNGSWSNGGAYSQTYNMNGTLTATGASNSTASKKYSYGDSSKLTFYSRTYSYTRGTSDSSKTIKSSIVNPANNAKGTGTYTVSKTFTIPALNKVKIDYDANGGDSAPADKSVTKGSTVNISTTLPKWGAHDFLNWNTKANGSGTSYAPGASITVSSNINLYAQWHESFVAPIFSNYRAYRVANNATGYSPNIAANGTRVYFECEYVPPRQNGGNPSMIVRFDRAPNSPVNLQVYTRQTVIGVDEDGQNIVQTTRFIYGYSPSGYNLANTLSDRMTMNYSVTDYRGNPHDYAVSTYVASEGCIWDAYANSNTNYKGFSVGGNAREASGGDIDPAGSIDGDFDCYMRANFSQGINVKGDIDGNVVKKSVAGQDNVHGFIGLSWTNRSPIFGVDDSTFKLVTERDIVVKTYETSDISVSGSADKSQSIAVSKNEYTPVGLVGYRVMNGQNNGKNSSYMRVYSAELSGNTVTVNMRNASSSAAVVRIRAKVLFIRNGFITFE